MQVVLFLERVHKASAATQSLLQVSSKYATIVCEDPPPLKSVFDFAGLFKVCVVYKHDLVAASVDCCGAGSCDYMKKSCLPPQSIYLIGQ